MPAAELVRLRQQINQLILSFHQPVIFCRLVRDLFELYAHHSYRPGQAITPQPLILSYRVPPLVMRQLTFELSKTSQELPQQAFEVISLLWQEPYLEPKVLASTMLGVIPVENAKVVQYLRDWAIPSENLRLIAILMENGTQHLRSEAPEQLFSLIDSWLANPNPAQKAIGLQALTALTNDRTFENLPAIYRLLGPSIQEVHPRLQTDLQIVLEALIRRSPTETAYFLRQTLPLSVGTGAARLIRRCLTNFEPAQQAVLRAALGSRNPT